MSHEQDLILAEILNGTYTLTPRRKARSVMWTILSEIVKEDGNIVEGYLYCRNCSTVLKYSIKQSSNLSRHMCCKSLKELNESSIKSVTAEDKKSATDNCLAWIIEDCQPFSAINGSGFLKLAKFLIKIGGKYGEDVDVEGLLPDPTTLSCTAKKLAEEKKKEMKEELADIVNSGGASATIDFWTDNYIHRNFLGVTLHYETNLKLHDIVLGMKSMDFERSTGGHILGKLNTLFYEFGINNIEQIKFVTDSGSNIVKALENKNRINCNSHLFSNVLEKSFKETAELGELVKGCKKIVKYLKKANLQHQLYTSLRNECPTRWNSNYTMFKSIVDNWLQVSEILKEKDETQRLLLISISTLKELVNLCGDFEIIFKKLELCSSPSLCFVIPAIQKVKYLCVSKETDVVAISSLKQKIINNVEKIWSANLNLWQKTACFLYPPAINMQKNDLNDIKDFCVGLIDNLYTNSTISIPGSPATTTSESQLSFDESNFLIDSDSESSNQTLIKKETHFFFSDLFKKNTLNTIKSSTEEVNSYSHENVEITEDFDVLKWWKSRETFYPNLSKIARQIHSIPASSAAAERAFSMAGNVITEKRNRLGPKSVDSIIFLHSVFKNVNN